VPPSIPPARETMRPARPRARHTERRGVMAETGRDGTPPYNYPRFDDYVAAGGDVADEAAF
jgi:hypothetical protein